MYDTILTSTHFLIIAVQYAVMKRIIIFCAAAIIIYLLGVIAINLPQKSPVVTKESTITVPTTIPTPSTAEPTGSQKPDVNL